MYLYVAITKKKVFTLRGKMLSRASCLDHAFCGLTSIHAKYIVKRVSDCILLVSWFINLRKYIEKIDRFAHGSFYCRSMFYLGCIRADMPLRFRLDGLSLTSGGLRGPFLAYRGANLWPSWANLTPSRAVFEGKRTRNTCIRLHTGCVMAYQRTWLYRNK